MQIGKMMTQKSPKGQLPPPMRVSQGALGQALRCSARTIRQYQEDGVLKPEHRDARGQYDLLASVGAVVEHLRNAAMGRQSATDDDGEVLNPSAEAAKLAKSRRLLTDLQAVKTKAQIKVAEAERRLIEGRALDVEIIMQAWGTILSTAKSRFRALPGSMAVPLHLDRRGMATLQDAIDDVLTSLAQDGESVHAEAAERQRIARAGAHTHNLETADHDDD